MLHMQFIIGLISIGFFIVTFEFIRKRYLREEYAILWLLTSLAIAVLSLWPGLIDIISRITGFYYITAILIVIFVFLIAILMHYSIVISRIKDMNKELVQRYALLEYKIKELEEKKNLK
ncbi:MAG TPA: DUF2304 domain-containing protein [Syntrophorhabdaceae bacterium]|nr:DUF2304 domain-containing protein [Syntrophorhabdaceae bacterium]HQE80212.1 DUF2304 domain-containing protein [Syntrophorhabdaceae bacterium]HQH43494.1 DUF2304 domain-containing protein [Syntrophorhabdaceae bacterium]HQK47074.1 DUF2304 domain-containing protein [Syntrophorhabdaceae bacterium]HRR71896.1 DUF2304 domain-containing protein [Syntrophorhabdaceae bacterium]